MPTSYDNFIVRERTLWSPFRYAMRLTTDQELERAIIFGMYSGAYKNGMAYLQTVEAFELAMILDEYNQQMAALDADEQNAILDIVTKRYISHIEDLMAAERRSSKLAEITADDEAWNAKFAALDADRAALLTLEAQYEGRMREISAKIAVLQSQILLEGMDYQLAAVDNLNKELDLARAANALAGKDIDLEMKDVEIAERDVALSQKDVEISQKDVDLSEQTNAIRKMQLAEAQTDLRVLEVGNDILKIQLEVVEQGLKLLDTEKEAANIRMQIAGMDADIAKTVLMEVDLAETGIELSSENLELSEQDIRIADIGLEERKTELQKKEIDMDYLAVNKELSGIAIDKAQLFEKSAQTGILEAQLNQETADLAAEQARLAVYPAKAGMVDAQTATITAEIANKTQRLANEATIHAADMDVRNADHDAKIADIQAEVEDRQTAFDQAVTVAQNDVYFVNGTELPLQTFTDLKKTAIEDSTINNSNRNDSAVELKQRIMEAELLTTLMHSIGKE